MILRDPLVITFCFLILSSQAQLSLSNIFTDNMVLQRDQPIVIWGRASPQEVIQVQFNGQSKSSICSADSSWKV
nr:hypothetical protein [Saprospiraceae bacterium]